jgi:hypothetical protein
MKMPDWPVTSFLEWRCCGVPLDCLMSMIAIGERVASHAYIVQAHYVRLLALTMATQSIIY